MCSLVILRRPESPWPVIIGANRDERVERPWQAPARHWPDRPDIVAGRDEIAGGAWIGVNDYGVVAAVLDRAGTLGPGEDKRSRGELVLEALDHADAVDAIDALSQLDPAAYRPFNLLAADNRDAWFLISRGDGRIVRVAVPQGISMITAGDPNDPAVPRVQRYLSRFRDAPLPDPDAPEAGGWASWQQLLGETGHDPGDETSAMCFLRADGFGTTNASLIALPAAGADHPPVWRFAPGRPDRTEWMSIALD
ncbi:MAG: NRDE family protein [Azospirillaceae bacterium]|nr:NRDE family protein [Azospirillaceae bacterium]